MLWLVVVVLVLVVLFVVVALWQPDWLVDSIHQLLLPTDPKERAKSNGVLFRVKIKRPDVNKVVALTLDDAPHKTLTPAILDVLKENNSRATFFCIGSHIEKVDPALIQRMRDEGHELGNHLMKDEAAIRLAPDELEKQLLETDKLIQPPGGWQKDQIKWFRPGHGFASREMLKQVEEHGYRIVLGNCYPFDPQTRSSTFSKWYLRAKVSPGAIIILHDGTAERTFTIDTLNDTLPYLKKKGYQVVTLSELLEKANE